MKTAIGGDPARTSSSCDATLHQQVLVTVRCSGDGRITVALDIVPDDDDPHALLSAADEGGAELARVKVSAGFRLNRASATAWADGGFGRP